MPVGDNIHFKCHSNEFESLIASLYKSNFWTTILYSVLLDCWQIIVHVISMQTITRSVICITSTIIYAHGNREMVTSHVNNPTVYWNITGLSGA